MNLPNILLDTLPNLADAPGLIGSFADACASTNDDRVVYLMVFLYDTFPPETLF